MPITDRYENLKSALINRPFPINQPTSSLNRQLGAFSWSTLLTKTSSDEVNLSSLL
jgi:hypothetical protein